MENNPLKLLTNKLKELFEKEHGSYEEQSDKCANLPIRNDPMMAMMVEAFDSQFDETMQECLKKLSGNQTIQDTDIKSFCTAKAKVFYKLSGETIINTAFRTFDKDESLWNQLDFDYTLERLNGEEAIIEFGRINTDLEKLKSVLQDPVKTMEVLKTLLADDYEVPNWNSSDLADLHFHAIRSFYRCGAKTGVPMNVLMKLDISASKLLVVEGKICGALAGGIMGKFHQKQSVIDGKRQQKDGTVDKILNAYKEIGAQWNDDAPEERPIMLKGIRVTKNKLAEKIFLQLRGAVTQRHINNYLKELHEKGEI